MGSDIYGTWELTQLTLRKNGGDGTNKQVNKNLVWTDHSRKKIFYKRRSVVTQLVSKNRANKGNGTANHFVPKSRTYVYIYIYT